MPDAIGRFEAAYAQRLGPVPDGTPPFRLEIVPTYSAMLEDLAPEATATIVHRI